MDGYLPMAFTLVLNNYVKCKVKSIIFIAFNKVIFENSSNSNINP